MAARPGSAAVRWPTIWMLVSACLITTACEEAPESEPTGQAEQEVAATVEGADATPTQVATQEARLRPFLPDEMQRSTRAESFPHDAHGQIGCAVCHESPEGHASHADVSCAECHRASGNARVTALTPAECQSCHHGADQAVACEGCHASRPTLLSVQQLSLEVWDAPRERSLEFDHALHGNLSCETCHRAMPALVPAEPCASCHTEHHTPEARCAACHLEPAPDAHGLEAHLTCSGAGCHRAPEVEAMATTRAVCLACHGAQTEHEPGGDCIECHRVRGDPVALAVWSHP